MEEKLQQIKASILNSEHTFPPLQELLLHSGELQAWFKSYSGPNPWSKRFYQEEQLFLTPKTIIVACFYADGRLALRSIRLDEISRIERDYGFAAKDSKDLVLAKVTILLKRTIKEKRPDALEIKRPLVEEQCDPESFDRFMALLD